MPAPRLTPPPFVGRSVELEQLVRAAAAPPSWNVITGEAGVGKTRLVSEVLDAGALQQPVRLVGRCFPSAEPQPLAPLIEALAGLPPSALTSLPPLAGALTPLLPELSGLLPPPLPPLGDARAERHRQLRAALGLLTHLRQAVLVLEDLHWADSATRDFIRLLTARPPRHLSVILTHRGDGAASLLPAQTGLRVRETHLEPLNPAETGRLAAHLIGAEEVSVDFAERLHQRTAGLPFAIEELLRLITTDDTSLEKTAIEQTSLPAPVRQVINHRLAQLPESARSVVFAAAVAGRPVTIDLISDIAALPEPDTRRALTLALEHAVLQPTATGMFDFRHTLARQAAYEAICLPERRTLHLRCARALLSHTAPLPLADIARHYQQAGHTEQYLRYREAAGNRAEAQGDAEAATEHFRTALRDHPSPRARIRLGLKLGRSAIAAMPHDDTVEELRALLQQDALTPVERGELRLYLGTLLRNQAGNGLEGLEEIARAANELTATAPHLAARALSAIAIPSLQGWPLPHHLQHLQQAAALAPYVDDPVQRTAITVNRATALMFTAAPDAWNAVRDLPVTTANPAEEVQIARGWANLAHATTALGHHKAATRYLDRADAILDHNGIPYLEGLAATARLLHAWTTGRWAGLAEATEQAASLYADIPDLAAEALLVRGLLHLHALGDTHEARHALVRAARTTQLDTGMVLTGSAAGIARIHLAADRPDHAGAAAEQALQHIRRTGGWIWATDIAPTAVEALLRCGRRDEALHLAEDLAQGVAGLDAPAATAAATTCQALLTPAHDAQATQHAYEAVVAAWQRAGRPYEEASARETHARRILADAPEKAETHLKEAAAIYHRIGAAWDVSRCHKQLRRIGVVITRRRGPIGYGDQLSPREKEVTALVAQGHSNREIAHRLSVSHRTVEHHISKAMRKLGVSRRIELIAGAHSPDMANPDSHTG
ncbi:AAA family ATPase [Streptomyces sp. NPDC006197]|uniref:helix-turn-helix transcriptional regulator n=1 Tax=Streptomyces sp. NPDC006197 TaxID=3156685 RepID=UPI0033A0840B